MTDAPTTPAILPPTGWYPDPDGGRGKRYWTGTEWATSLSLEQRREAMQGAITDAVRRGWRVESQADGQAVIVKGSRPNHILHLLLTIFTLGLWLIPWIIISIAGGEERKTLTVTAEGRALEA